MEYPAKQSETKLVNFGFMAAKIVGVKIDYLWFRFEGWF